MYKCIVYGVGKDYNQYINSLRFYEQLQTIKILGVSSKQQIYEKVDGYDFISKEQLLCLDYDLIVITSARFFMEIRKDLIELGIDEEKLMPAHVFTHPELDLDKYLQLKKSKPSIFAIHCWGGVTYCGLGLKFLSPFINMWEEAEDYLKILQNPQEYLKHPVEFLEYAYDPLGKKEYPVGRLNDVKLHFNHYASYEKAVQKWDERKKRINWNNLFIMMYTEEKEVAKKFMDLPYKNKVCFVPFETKEESLFFIDYRNYPELENMGFARLVNQIAKGAYQYYDVIELLMGNINKNRVI